MNSDILNKIDEFTVREVLAQGVYEIPIYQRNYAWESAEVYQLVEDIADYAKLFPTSSYYLGNLITYPRFIEGQRIYEVIDGQQRLTTLNILACRLKRYFQDYPSKEAIDFTFFDKRNLQFNEYRSASNRALETIFRYEKEPSFDSHIFVIYDQSLNIIKQVCNEKDITIETFTKYFLNHTKLLRIIVPEHTDLNHYFEIMNSRGEQLEKHEILKARLMNQLKAEELQLYNLIWQACSNMHSYVQMNFMPALRKLLFSDNYNTYTNLEFDDLFQAVNEINSINDKKTEDKIILENKEDSVLSIITKMENVNALNAYTQNAMETSERFHSLSIFSQFLLHALKTYGEDNKNVALDDKQLLDQFDCKKINSKDFSKKFIMHLLKIRYLFDTYIIKRENTTNNERWSLQSLIHDENGQRYKISFEDENNINKDIAMLQAMFHVSSPSQNYKYWLYGALLYLKTNFDNSSLTAIGFYNYLFTLAKAYMLDRYLAKKKDEEGNESKQIDHSTIIDENNSRPRNSIADLDFELLNKGTEVENIIFNFYDYLLWQSDKNKYEYFEFTARDSVEHFYPQNPSDGKQTLDQSKLDNFGNLALLSRGMNSKFTNNMPHAKSSNFGHLKDRLSIKLNKMMQDHGKIPEDDSYREKFVDFINKNYEEAKGILEKKLSEPCD